MNKMRAQVDEIMTARAKRERRRKRLPMGLTTVVVILCIIGFWLILAAVTGVALFITAR